jgi:citrate/tricarballylate utilization protein
MAKIRKESYAHYAWPSSLGRLYQRQGFALSLALVFAFAVMMFVANALIGSTAVQGQQSFYAVMPHETMVLLFGSVFLFAILAMAIGAIRFWREQAVPTQAGADKESLAAIVSLRYLDGGGDGCVEQSDAPSLARGIYTMRLSTASCCASHRPRWQPCITMVLAGKHRMIFRVFQ